MRLRASLPSAPVSPERMPPSTRHPELESQARSARAVPASRPETATVRQSARKAEADRRDMCCDKRISAFPQVKPAPRRRGGARRAFPAQMQKWRCGISPLRSDRKLTQVVPKFRDLACPWPASGDHLVGAGDVGHRLAIQVGIDDLMGAEQGALYGQIGR